MTPSSSAAVAGRKTGTSVATPWASPMSPLEKSHSQSHPTMYLRFTATNCREASASLADLIGAFELYAVFADV